MENAEKMQDVSKQVSEKTPEEVQNATESTTNNSEQKNEELSPSSSPPTPEDQPTPTVVQSPESSADYEAKSAQEVSDTPSEEPENDETTEEEDDEESVVEEEMDLSHAGSKELLITLKEIKNEDNIRQVDRVIKAAKSRFDELYEKSKNEALQAFVSDGNEADAFEYHGDEVDKEFTTLYGQLKSRRNKHYRDLENERTDNLKKKETLLEKLREIVDGVESEHSINGVREIQAEWKKVGMVPGAQNKTLWANYNALLDRYYDNRSIYFELKDLDRKKNFVLKEEVCQRAEALAQSEDIKAAVMQLNDLHEEYKHIGPVPKEDQEPLWQRFKAASDAIYAKRKEYFEGLKTVFEENLIRKQELVAQVSEYVNYTSEKITQWNEKTKEVLDIQKKWEIIGSVPKDKAKEVNRAFWHSFKAFFSNKNKFFKGLESKREENLAKKEELIQKAEELKESTDWNATADKLKHLQSQWREIGPVPEKVKNQIYKRFKAACDHFFDRRRDQNQEQFKEYEENLKLKLQICDQLEEQTNIETPDVDVIYDLVDDFTALGFVPKNAINKIRKRFDDVKSKLMSCEAISEEDRAALQNHIHVGRLKNAPGGDRKLERRVQAIRRSISNLENDISTWKTNMDFFAASATADKLKEEMQERIEQAQQELGELKAELRALRA